MKKIFLVGIGAGNSDFMIKEAENVVKNADCIIGAKRMIESVNCNGKQILTSYDYDEISAFIHNCNCNRIAVLMSGDCGFFSGAEKLLPLVSDLETEIIPAVSSIVYFFAKIKKPWQDAHFVSLHGAHANVVRKVCTHEKILFLLGGKQTAADICSLLCQYGLGELPVFLGEKLSYEDEKVINGKASDFINCDTDNLSLMLVENADAEKALRSGIPDREFVRGTVPMTKSEIRSIVISKLGISRDSVCWDIGGGTGSVSVEMALACSDGLVYSIEKNPDAVALISENKRKFKCDNIEIIQGEAPAELSVLPAPQHVFIGGAGGNIRSIVEIVQMKSPSAVIVVTAVSLETLHECLDVFGSECEVTQVAVTRTKKLGQHTMLSAENPIYIVKGSLKCDG